MLNAPTGSHDLNKASRCEGLAEQGVPRLLLDCAADPAARRDLPQGHEAGPGMARLEPIGSDVDTGSSGFDDVAYGRPPLWIIKVQQRRHVDCIKRLIIECLTPPFPKPRAQMRFP